MKKKATGAAKQCVIDLYSSGLKTLEQACKVAGVTRSCHYLWVEKDPSYAADFATAREQRSEILDDEAYRRAVVGTLKPVFQGGKKIGTIRECSDLLLIFLLKGANPAKYRERFEKAADVVVEHPRPIGVVVRRFCDCESCEAKRIASEEVGK